MDSACAWVRQGAVGFCVQGIFCSCGTFTGNASAMQSAIKPFSISTMKDTQYTWQLGKGKGQGPLHFLVLLSNAGDSNSLIQIANQVKDGHTVSVEAEAGKGAGFSDQEYSQAGCMITDVDRAWKADLIVKAKEMQTWEYARPHPGQSLMMFQVS